MRKTGKLEKRLLVAAALVLVCAPVMAVPLEAAASPGFPTTTLADGREVVAGRIIVGFREAASPAERGRLVADMSQSGVPGVQVVSSLGPHGQVLDVSGAQSLDDALSTLRADPRVSYAEPDTVVHALDVPNDPQFPSQWSLPKIQAPSAWGVTHSSSTVTIAVLDCGIYEAGSTTRGPGHPDINAKVDTRQDFTASTTGTDDLCNHGTHVAGIAAAVTNNGVGIAGVGYDAHVLNGKVVDDTGAGSISWMSNGIYWATDHGARVINLSLGGLGSCGLTEQTAIEYAWAHNAVIVAAAGNHASSAQVTPASCNHVISVASTGTTDALSSFSTFGTWVSVAAPGENILSLNNTGSYMQLSGTSMSTPHVSGLAALVWSTSFGTSNQFVVNRITGTADQVPGTGTNWQYGRINAAAAVGAPSVTPTPTPSATPTVTLTPTATATLTPTATPVPVGHSAAGGVARIADPAALASGSASSDPGPVLGVIAVLAALTSSALVISARRR